MRAKKARALRRYTQRLVERGAIDSKKRFAAYRTLKRKNSRGGQ